MPKQLRIELRGVVDGHWGASRAMNLSKLRFHDRCIASESRFANCSGTTVPAVTSKAGEQVIEVESPDRAQTHRSQTFRPEIQGLRAIAVGLVILNHANFPGLKGGFIGVDVFFVISGYVITSLLRRQPVGHVGGNLANFYSRRIRRIVPAATIAIVGTVFAAHALLGANYDPQLLSDARWASLFSANFRFISVNANYFIPGISPSLVTHFWSLGVEEQFYLVIPFVVFSIAAIAALRHQTIVLASFFVVVIVASGAWCAHIVGSDQVAAYFSPFARVWELALGALAALIPSSWFSRMGRWAEAVALGCLATIVASAILIDGTRPPGLTVAWACLATAGLLLVGPVSANGGAMSFLRARPAVYLGDISYSLYLYHYAWLMIPLEMVHPHTGVLWKVFGIIGALACSMISYHVIENPIRHSRRLDRDKLAVLLLLAVCIAVTWDVTRLVGGWGVPV